MKARSRSKKNTTATLTGPTEVGTTRSAGEAASLPEIIRRINEKFGTDFTAADALFRQQVEEDLVADAKLVEQAKRNTRANFRYGF